MRKRSERKDPQDQEIIDLTEVVEEPSESFQMNGAQRSSTNDFEDIEDLFEELDLEFPARNDSTSAPFINDRSGSIKGGQQNTDRSTTKDTASDLIQTMEARIQALEEKIVSTNHESWKDVENRIMARLDTMVQERIHEAKLTIQEEIETGLRPHQEGQPSSSIRELAQKIEDIKHYAVGPETLSALKNELWTELSQRIDETVPQAAAKVVREEIQALLDEEAGDGFNASEEKDNMTAND